MSSPKDQPVLELKSVSKRFHMHQQGSITFKVLENVTFSIFPGECVALEGPSGMGKSSILKMIYGNYNVSSGQVLVQKTPNVYVDVALGNAREILQLRQQVFNYVSQFLRVIPRVGAFELIKQEVLFHNNFNPLHHKNLSIEALEEKVKEMLNRLNIPKRLWHLPPSTFSGGEQQRINIAKGLINPKPILLLDEPSASLDNENAAIVVELLQEVRDRGTAILGIFHDANVKQKLATRIISMHDFQPKP